MSFSIADLFSPSNISTLSTALSAGAEGIIEKVTLDSEYTAPIELAKPLASDPSPPNAVIQAILGWLKPRVTINYTSGYGLKPTVIARYGVPTPLTPNQTIFANIVTFTALASIGALVIRGLTCHRCSR
jgi:hypothetical protein